MSQKNCSPLVFIFACFLFFVPVKSQDKEDIINNITAAFANQINPGLTVTVVQNGETVLAEGFGVKDDNTGEAVTNNTLFGIGTLSEHLSATLLKMIFSESEFYYDKHLRKLGITPPNIKKLFKSSFLRSNYSSSRDLGAHRMGNRKHTYLRFDDTLNRANAMSRYQYLKASGRFRDSFYFSVHDYCMLCVVLQKLGDKPFETLMQEKLLTPLDMTSTKFWTTDNLAAADMATGYIDYYNKLYPVSTEFLKNLTKLGCADTIAMSGLDMGRWMKFIQADGKTANNKSLISKSRLEDLRKRWLRIQTSSSRIKVPNTPHTYSLDAYGVGLRVGHYRGHRISGQNGYIYGYTSHLTMFEDSNLSIYTAMTGEDEDHTFQIALHAYLADWYLGMAPWLNATTLGNRLANFIPTSTKTAPTFNRTLSISENRTPSNYTGTYQDNLYGHVTITSDNGQLKMIYGFVTFKLYPKVTEDHFYFESVGPAEKVVNNANLQFTFTPNSTELLIPSFERKQPPKFTKI